MWIINAPKLSSENIDKYTMWVNTLVQADLPDPEISTIPLSWLKHTKSIEIQYQVEN